MHYIISVQDQSTGEHFTSGLRISAKGLEEILKRMTPLNRHARHAFMRNLQSKGTANHIPHQDDLLQYRIVAVSEGKIE